MGAQPRDRLGSPEPRVGPEDDLAGGACAADAADRLVDEAGHPAGGVGCARPQPGVQHLAGVGAGGQQRVVAELVGVAVGGALLVMAVDLADRGVGVDDQLAATRPGARCPGRLSAISASRSSWRTCPKVKLRRNVPTVEAAMHPVAEHAAGRPGAQHLDVVDAVATSDQGVYQREHLGAGMAAPGRSPRSTSSSAARSMPSRSASVAGSSSPAPATA